MIEWLTSALPGWAKVLSRIIIWASLVAVVYVVGAVTIFPMIRALPFMDSFVPDVTVGGN